MNLDTINYIIDRSEFVTALVLIAAFLAVLVYRQERHLHKKK